MLAITVGFPSGVYYGAEADAANRAEWPPHPSRLFSALVAAAGRGGLLVGEHRATLEWLEALPPPLIAAPVANASGAPVSYVPPADIVGRKGKKGEERYEHPFERWRQPRHFPAAVILGEPEVTYVWSAEPVAVTRDHLDDIARWVTHVGTSHSLAVVSVSNDERPPSLVPDASGDRFLRVARAGRLAELDRLFEGEQGVRRPPPRSEVVVGYREVARPDATAARDWASSYVFRLSGGYAAADDAHNIGKAVRRAVMSVLGDNAPACVHGHDGDVRVGWLPLPDVGHSNATGRLIGVSIVVPNAVSAAERAQLLRALGQVSVVNLVGGRQFELRSLPIGEMVPQALRQATWRGPASLWSTVTPVVLDRPPKKSTPDTLAAALRECFRHAGYPEPEVLEFGHYSHFAGAPSTFAVASKLPRFHATIRFAEPIAGPVVAGRLRNFGIGLFRPWEAGSP